MELNQKHSYFCVACGEEIKPDQIDDKIMVSLSYAALDGASEGIINRFPVYITRKELVQLIERQDSNGRQFISLEEYLEFAYNRVNKNDLDDTRSIDAKTAIQVYRDSKEDTSLENEEEDEALEDKEYQIPGFNETAIAQIVKNFPNEICYLDWKINETNGYFFQLTEKYDAKKKITPCWVCAHCKEEILSCAFDYKHILIGLLGFASAGKTCLIAALCHTLLEQGGVLTATKKSQGEYEDLLADYNGGYTLEKTDEHGYNTYHPSVQKDDILWTFVDIPGEVFFDNAQHGMDMEKLVSNPKLQMSLKCHAYILTADQEIADNGLKRSSALNTFESFINFAEEFNEFTKRGVPLVFALTKVDQVSPNEEAKNLPSYCNQNSYPKRYRTELSIINNKGLSAFVDTLAKKNYVFATTCAPYGFSPLATDDPARGVFLTRDHKAAWIENYLRTNPEVAQANVPHPVYQHANPRNVLLIMEWLEKLFGVKPIVYDSENDLSQIKNLSQVSRYDGHFDDIMVSMIASMFCNPNEWDLRWYNTIGDFSLFKRLKQEKISRDYTDARNKGKKL